MIVTVRLDEDAEAKLRRLVKRNGGSLSAFVRAAIAEKLEREAEKPTPYELGKHLFGRYRGGPPDLAENHKKYFKERMRAKHRR
jgi:Arc/MetJ-type ribon-helix-helix transcriptional regulator